MAKKIIFVDDEPDVMRVTVFRLKKAGYEVITGVNGQEAIDLAKTQNPDLMLLDLRLPLMLGSEVCRLMKSDDALKHIPVILFTASVRDMAEKIKESGADDFLSKPFDHNKLLEKIGNFIGNK